MESCAFCEIGKGKLPAHIVYEDEKIVAFLDKHPINPGHILVVPKVHESDFYNLDELMYGKVMSIVQYLAKRISQKIQPKKVGVVIAGFDVPHTHVHIIPMHVYDDITSRAYTGGQRANPPDAELADMASKLK